jgi:hypothetical protein
MLHIAETLGAACNLKLLTNVLNIFSLAVKWLNVEYKDLRGIGHLII